MDRNGIYDQRRRMDVHNKMANLGKGDYLSVTEYYRLERYRTKVMYRDVPTRDEFSSSCKDESSTISLKNSITCPNSKRNRLYIS